MLERQATGVPGSPTPEQRAAACVAACFGPPELGTSLCIKDEQLTEAFAAVIRAAVAEDRERLATRADDIASRQLAAAAMKPGRTYAVSYETYHKDMAVQFQHFAADIRALP